MEFVAVLEFLDGASLFVLGVCDSSVSAAVESFCRDVVKARNWICGVGQSARQRVSRGGVFIDGITAYHDATQQPCFVRSS